MQRLHLKMSQEKKDAQRKKERLSKNAKHCTETQEECAKCKKIMQECVRRQWQTETDEQGAQRKKTECECKTTKQKTETSDQAAKHKKIMQECVRRQGQTETNEQGALRKKTDCDCKTTKQKTETSDQAAKHRKIMQECVRRQRLTETSNQAAKCKKTDCDCKTRKHEEMRHQSQNDSRDCNGEDMTNIIDHATKEAKQFSTGHGIQQTPISIGQLCVLHVIVSSSAQKPFTSLPRKTLAHTVKDLASKDTKSTTKPH